MMISGTGTGQHADSLSSTTLLADPHLVDQLFVHHASDDHTSSRHIQVPDDGDSKVKDNIMIVC